MKVFHFQVTNSTKIGKYLELLPPQSALEISGREINEIANNTVVVGSASLISVSLSIF